MKTLLILLVFLSQNAKAQEKPTFVAVKRVIDGDTFQITGMIYNKLDLRIRVRGIDTPEKGRRAKCPKEAEKAELATKLGGILLQNKDIMIDNLEWDKYGGRIVADVYINNKSYAKEMLNNGLAKPYSGKGKKPNWCK